MNAINHAPGPTRVKTKKRRSPIIKDRNPLAPGVPRDSRPRRSAENLRINDPLAVGIEELADHLDWRLRNPRNDVELTALMRRMWPESTGPAHSFETQLAGPALQISDFRGCNGVAANAGCEDAARTPGKSLAPFDAVGSAVTLTRSIGIPCFTNGKTGITFSSTVKARYVTGTCHSA